MASSRLWAGMAVLLPASTREATDLSRGIADKLGTAGPEGDQAASALAELVQLAREQPEGAPIRLTEVDFFLGNRREHLELLLLPSIFAPEQWAFTFLEGLLKLPLEHYRGRRLVEVGTGSGWICIALARCTQLTKIVGVDLNPHSAILARCNAWLNGGAELLARVDFRQSDLLGAVPRDDPWDFVVGCIPQVLRPDLAPGADEDQALQDLSNYCATQNVYEDQFGLGLIARLLDDVPEFLGDDGQVLLNLAGRPGRDIIRRMFSRRGFTCEVLFARRVRQASDTDIRPLAELETKTGRAFEFFMEAHSAQPLCAGTAAGWIAAGGSVFHEVAVWQAQARLPRELRGLRHGLDRLAARDMLGALDLSTATAEQLEFVAWLAERMADAPVLPYAHEAGDLALRTSIATYLARYYGLHLRPEALFVAPERIAAVYALVLCACDPGDQVLMCHNLVEVYRPAIDKARVTPIYANESLKDIRRLLAAFSPKVLLLSISASERDNIAGLKEILEEAHRRQVLVVLDDSADFTITSEVASRTILELLAAQALPNVVALYGLIKNAVYPDFELTILLPVSETLAGDLEVAAECTYSRIGALPQWYYQRLFDDLVAFRVSFTQEEASVSQREAQGQLPRSARIQQARSAPAFHPKPFHLDDPRLIRLDYGENEAPVPQVLIQGILAGATSSTANHLEPGLHAAVAAFLLETRGLRCAPEDILIGQGVWPLLHDLGIGLGTRLGRRPRVWIATPCYGLLAPSLELAGCEVEPVPLTELLAMSHRGKPDAVVVAQPGNPAGEYLSHEELVGLASWIVNENVVLICDEIFGLLNLTNVAAERVASPAALDAVVPGISARTWILGGVAKEFAAGGLRVGWLAGRERGLGQAVATAILGRPTKLAAHAATWLYDAYVRVGGKLLYPERHRAVRDYLVRLRSDLKAKRATCLAAFGIAGDEPGREVGGLFIAPNVQLQIAAMNLSDSREWVRAVYEQTGVMLNDGPWCSEEHRVRAVFSIPDERLREAAKRLAELLKEP